MSAVISSLRWDAAGYFRKLCETNRLCRDLGFRFVCVSGLQGFEDVVNQMQGVNNFICVSDASEGMLELLGTPHIRQVRTVFMAMRHSVQSAEAENLRRRCLDVEREIFRQFISALQRETTLIDQGNIALLPGVQFSEIDRYFLSGCAASYFQLGVTQWFDHSYNPDEWTQ